jgi:DNA-binding response OmpR family regulator
VDHKVLVIDDDPTMLEMLKVGLSGDRLHVETAANGTQGVRQFYEQPPDVVILDLMLPDMSGWAVFQSIRRCSAVPVIFLSALDQVIAGLEEGAADYVTKPFSLKVLQARLQAVLRRTTMPAPTPIKSGYDDGYLAIDLNRRTVAIGGTITRLSRKEFALLAYLFQNAGRVLTFRQILTRVWGDQSWDDDAYVHIYICHLRQKLERDPKQPTYILTIPGWGYRFATPRA